MVNSTVTAFDIVFERSLSVPTLQQVDQLIKKVYPKAAIITHPVQGNDQIFPKLCSLKDKSVIFIATPDLGMLNLSIGFKPGVFKIYPRGNQEVGYVDQPARLCANIRADQDDFNEAQVQMLRKIVPSSVASAQANGNRRIGYSALLLLLLSIATVVYKCLFNKPLRTYTVIS